MHISGLRMDVASQRQAVRFSPSPFEAKASFRAFDFFNFTMDAFSQLWPHFVDRVEDFLAG
jgi:hypothetical protein